MNWDQIEGKWKQSVGKVKEKWGKLTDDDLTAIQSPLSKHLARQCEPDLGSDLR